jgi:hypothetical protein
LLQWWGDGSNFNYVQASAAIQADEKHSASVLIINIINFNKQRFGAGRSMNTAAAASHVRNASPY